MSDDSEPSPSKSFRIYGKDVSEIPCFRSTFLTSICTGLVSGFMYFLFTSKTRQATHVGYGTFLTVTVGYWVYCRYNWAFQKHQMNQITAAARQMALLEGTEQDVRQVNDSKEE